ncbi:hypothetical protein BGZ98_010249 [Dissophora globulifera]|nr:hypothetical protein BGZ98_010249 [Dissophora globulifera]
MAGIPAAGMMMAHSGGAPFQSTIHELQKEQEWVHVLLEKRIVSWKYLTRVFQGGMVLYNTAMVSAQDMRHIWADEISQRRSIQFFLLGTSLATILEIPNSVDYIRALSQVLQEYDNYIAAEARSKSIFFKPAPRKVGIVADIKAFEETGEYSHLEVKDIPFNLDFVVTAATLSDMITLVYEKMLRLLQHDEVWSLISIETFQKVDLRFKKMLTRAYKDIESVARDVMLEELKAVDPLALLLHDYDWDI